jgi:LuxR family maltose regulon positive regulatory protein
VQVVDEDASSRHEPRRKLFESKLIPPIARSETVPRTRVLDRLDTDRDSPIVSVVAPPGYGKTTLLTQWAERSAARVAWLSVDEGDNDPESLLAYTAAALDRVEPIDLEWFRRPAPRGLSVASSVVPQLAGAMYSMSQPVSLFLDHVDLLHNRECLDAIAELALHLPAGSQLAMATRGDPPLPIARLRAGRSVLEIGVPDLAMNEVEARALLTGAGLELPDAETAALLERTEGWPVGLYLAALALKAGGRELRGGMPFSGDDRLMADYLRSELLARLSDEDVTFLTRTSVLDRMSGGLCDAVLDDTGSARVLETLERSNLLLVALDRRREWYRYHRLFRDLLRTELKRREPDVEVVLHRRAAAWCEDHGEHEMAIEHAQAGGDVDRAARLVFLWSQYTYAQGRAETAHGWLSWLEGEGHIDRYPAPAVLGAVLHAFDGQPAAAERWAAAVECTSADEVLPDGSRLSGWKAWMRMLLCRDGVADLVEQAGIARAGLSPTSMARPVVLVLEGLAFFLQGESDRADTIMAHAVDTANAAGATGAVAVGLAERGVIAIERDDWPGAAAFVEEALETVERARLDEYSLSALVYALVARVALHKGDVDRAREYAAQVARLRPLLSYAVPHLSVQSLLELARVYIALADTSGARAVLREVRDILQQRPHLGVLSEHAEAAHARLDSMRMGTVGASSLTTAELRLLPFLSTHLSFPEIGERLHVSRHTVKTQAISIYQKLGVSSRSEAIERMQEIGLLSA